MIAFRFNTSYVNVYLVEQLKIYNMHRFQYILC